MKYKLMLSAGIISFAMTVSANDGVLDKSFADNGAFTDQVAGGAFGMEVLNNGKIILAGNIWFETSDLGVLKLNADGSKDMTFGESGESRFDLGGYEIARDVAIQADGKIVLAGITKSTKTKERDWAIARLNANGSVDSSFGYNGVFTYYFDTVNVNDEAKAVAIQNDGKIVVVGQVFHGGQSKIGMIRLNTDGSLDNNFGTGGVVLVAITNDDDASSLDIQSDGKILVGGRVTSQGQAWNYYIGRFNPDGSPDQSFGTNGYLNFDSHLSSNLIYDVQVLNNGKIMAVGETTTLTSVDFALFRFEANGDFDNTFGTNGQVFSDWDNEYQRAKSFDVQSDGKIVVAGDYILNSKYGMMTARYSSNGLLDATFGNNGSIFFESDYSSYSYNIQVLDQDYILVSGQGSSSYFTLFKLVGNCQNPAAISMEPLNQTVCENVDAIFPTVTYYAQSYQWQKQVGNEFEDIVGQTTADLSFVEVKASAIGNYRMIAIHACGLNDTTNVASLNVTSIDLGVQISGNTLTAAQTNAKYQWIKCGINDSIILGATNSFFTPTSSGEYKVRITYNGCEMYSDCQNYISNSTIENSKLNSINVFPNPSHNNVSLMNDLPILEIQILNSIGQIVANEIGNNTNQQFLELPSSVGVYTIKIKDENGVKFTSVVKN